MKGRACNSLNILLLEFLTEIFEVIGRVLAEIVTDNMKTVMDKARTEHLSFGNDF